jgi:hypothetical protein
MREVLAAWCLQAVVRVAAQLLQQHSSRVRFKGIACRQ